VVTTDAHIANLTVIDVCLVFITLTAVKDGGRLLSPGKLPAGVLEHLTTSYARLMMSWMIEDAKLVPLSHDDWCVGSPAWSWQGSTISSNTVARIKNSKGRSLTIVYGPAGCGKTNFIQSLFPKVSGSTAIFEGSPTSIQCKDVLWYWEPDAELLKIVKLETRQPNIRKGDVKIFIESRQDLSSYSPDALLAFCPVNIDYLNLIGMSNQMRSTKA
jgi:hypothetical protein